MWADPTNCMPKHSLKSVRGQFVTLAEAGKILGLSQGGVQYRLKQGMYQVHVWHGKKLLRRTDLV